MFTGLIERVGRVELLERAEDDLSLWIASPEIASASRMGDSISVNGVCLTVEQIRSEAMRFTAVDETLRRTNLAGLELGSPVNLERPLSLGDRLGGHLVQGHVDGMGTIKAIQAAGEAHVLTVDLPHELGRYLVEKGSIAVDGISLTVASLTPTGFQVWIIPHTWGHTNLAERSLGDLVNIEVDILAKYVERLASPYGGLTPAGLTE